MLFYALLVCAALALVLLAHAVVRARAALRQTERELALMARAYNRDAAYVGCDEADDAASPCAPAAVLLHERLVLRKRIPVVVYVWNRPTYFEAMLRQLRAVRGVQQTLLLVSMDGPVDAMMAVAERELRGSGIAWRRIVHPVRGAHAPSFGALKEHWWWMLGEVFDAQLPRAYDGPVLFVEEDHLLAPDALELLHELHAMQLRMARDDMWGVALSNWGFSESDDPYELRLAASHANTGYAFNRTMWERMRATERALLAFPDGWDWSVYYAMQLGLLPDVMLYPALSRVHNIGAEGLSMNADAYERSGLGRAGSSSSSSSSAGGARDWALLRASNERLAGEPRPRHLPVRCGWACPAEAGRVMGR